MGTSSGEGGLSSPAELASDRLEREPGSVVTKGLLLLTIFLGAFLLFSVELLLGRYLLPWFGGTPAVWSTCMLLYQIGLLGGYLYAYRMANRSFSRSRLYLALLLISLVFLPAIPSIALRELLGGWPPSAQIALLLLAAIGLPFVLLSATSPLLQYWHTRIFPGRSPYHLYAVSNCGSLLALISYPLAAEPFLSLRVQSLVWSTGYAIFVLCSFLCAMHPRLKTPVKTGDQPGPSASGACSGMYSGQIGLWMGLAALGSIMLLATTNRLCHDVAVVPLLWPAVPAPC